MKIFLDTMIWLHYQPIDDVDIRDVASAAEPITIVVPRITLKELDKHKDQHKSSKVRDRARRTLNLIEQASGDPNFRLKNGVQIELYQRIPFVDFEKLGLSKESGDEYLIATVLTYQSERPNEVVWLYTEDTTPRITAKPLGVNAVAFPEHLKLAPEPDPLEKENRELKAELNRLKTARPNLEFGFLVNGVRAGTLVINLEKPVGFATEAVNAMIQELRVKYPHKPIAPTFQPGDNAAFVKQLLSMESAAIPREEYARYNRDVDEYLKAAGEFFRRTHQQQVEKTLSHPLRIQVANVGSVPAEDVDVWLHFPDGCLLYEELPEEMEEPSPPVAPMSRLEMMHNGLGLHIPSSRLNDFGSLKLPGGFSLRKTNSYEITDHFNRIKHGHAECVNEFILTFSAFDSAASFQVDYRVTAANLPTPLVGTLNVRVEKRT
jgi:hypothetical protein